jgi:uncharacterized protein (DUF1697 family)
MGHYVALLRGINVGGKNLIKMPALKACLEAQGLRDVVTYIQSGNVVFQSGEPRQKLTRLVEGALGAAFNYQATVVLRSRKQLQDIVEGAPRGFGANPTKHRYDVIFLKEPLSAAVAMKSVRTKEGVDEAHAGVGALYFSRLISKASQSLLSRILAQPVYKSMTIRNWNTTTALLRMMQTGTAAVNARLATG